MQKPAFLLVIALSLNFCNSSKDHNSHRQIQVKDSIIKIEMNLSAFGVESDNFPSIAAYIDFKGDSGTCTRSYYDPSLKASVYYLSKNEIESVLGLLKNSDLKKLKDEYKIEKTDQPTSTTIIYTTKEKFTIKDYGLKGEYPLTELYRIVYKF